MYVKAVCFEVVCYDDLGMLLLVFIIFLLSVEVGLESKLCYLPLERMVIMQGIYARFNEQKNCVDVTVYEAGYILRLDCGKWEDGIKTTMNSQGRLDALAIDDPLEYVRLALDDEMQIWVEALDDNRVW